MKLFTLSLRRLQTRVAPDCPSHVAGWRQNWHWKLSWLPVQCLGLLSLEPRTSPRPGLTSYSELCWIWLPGRDWGCWNPAWSLLTILCIQYRPISTPPRKRKRHFFEVPDRATWASRALGYPGLKGRIQKQKRCHSNTKAFLSTWPLSLC